MTREMERRVVVPVGVEQSAPESVDELPADGLITISRLADDLLPTLIARVDASALGELEVRRNGWCVRLRRQPGIDDERATRRTRSRQAERRAERVPEPAGGPDGAQRHEPEPGTVTAPAVGYYLPLDSVNPGATLRGGDLLGHVDVLGVRVDVVVPVDGRLARVLAEPGEAVEYGQPLARLEAESRA